MAVSGEDHGILKCVDVIGLPAHVTLYQTLSGALGWHVAEQVVYTISGLGTAPGVILGVSTVTYQQGKDP